MNKNTKEERKYIILGHIVHSYVSTAAPISSKIVAERMGRTVSSATIRNIMAELESHGYIEQPHISAGRIPTNSGYRHYVDRVKNKIRMKKKEAQRLAGEYNRRIRTIKEVIEKTSFLISRELHNAGVVMWPSIEDFYLKHLQLIKVRSETVLAVLVTMTNAVRNHMIKLDKELKKTDLERISNFINTNYESMSFSRISEDIKSTLGIKDKKEEISEVAESALKVVDFIIEENIGNDIYWEGLDYFINEPEFMDVSVTRRVLHMFSNKDDLVRIMREDLLYEGIKVHIGSENNCDMLNECSIITCGYTLHDRTVGRLGVIGPTRMDYDHALRTVSCLSDLISLKLKDINGEG